MCCCRSSTRRVTRERRHDRRRHRPDRVLEGVGPQRAAARGRGVAAAIADAGLTPADIDGMVTFTDRLERRARRSCAALGIPEVRYWSRTPVRRRGRVHHHAARGGRGRLRRGERGARVPRVQRAVGPALRSTACRSPGRRTLDWYRPFGLDTPAKMYSLWFQRYMDEFGADQRRLRPLHGRRPPSRGDQPERVVLPAPDHPRRPPAVALDRRADPAPARLLPGERRRRRARRHQCRARPRPAATGGRASRPRPTATSATAT